MPETITCNCDRCGCPCQVADEPSSPEARPIRKARVAKGCCGNCAITQYIKTGPLMDVIPGGHNSVPGFDIGQVLRMPHVQQQFAAVFRAGHISDIAAEVDWEQVIDNWDLP